MASYVGNLSDLIDFDLLLKTIGSGYHEDSHMVDESGNILEECSRDIRWKKLYDAGYPGLVCSGKIYTAGYHFSEQVVHKLDSYFNTICLRVLISEFQPGHVAAPHFDYIREGRPDLEEQILSLGSVEAYHIHLGDPEEGHVFIINGKCHYLEDPGNCYKWDYYRDWHRASNTGFDKKYLMTYFGLKPYQSLPPHTYRFHEDTEQVDLVFSDGSIL